MKWLHLIGWRDGRVRHLEATARTTHSPRSLNPSSDNSKVELLGKYSFAYSSQISIWMEIELEDITNMVRRSACDCAVEPPGGPMEYYRRDNENINISLSNPKPQKLKLIWIAAITKSELFSNPIQYLWWSYSPYSCLLSVGERVFTSDAVIQLNRIMII